LESRRLVVVISLDLKKDVANHPREAEEVQLHIRGGRRLIVVTEVVGVIGDMIPSESLGEVIYFPTLLLLLFTLVTKEPSTSLSFQQIHCYLNLFFNFLHPPSEMP